MSLKHTATSALKSCISLRWSNNCVKYLSSHVHQFSASDDDTNCPRCRDTCKRKLGLTRLVEARSWGLPTPAAMKVGGDCRALDSPLDGGATGAVRFACLPLSNNGLLDLVRTKMTGTIPVLDHSFYRTFGTLVLGCIDANNRNQRLIV